MLESGCEQDVVDLTIYAATDWGRTIRSARNMNKARTLELSQRDDAGNLTVTFVESPAGEGRRRVDAVVCFVFRDAFVVCVHGC